jgi:hypothetical protein
VNDVAVSVVLVLSAGRLDMPAMLQAVTVEDWRENGNTVMRKKNGRFCLPGIIPSFDNYIE